MDDEKARKFLGVETSEWIVAVNDSELAMLKSALRLHAEEALRLANKIDEVGT